MKKIFLCLIAVLLFSCEEQGRFLVSVTNGFGRTVHYIYNENSEEIKYGETKVYEVESNYIQAPSDVKDEYGIASVKIMFLATKNKYTFVEADYYNMNVINKFPLPVTIKADNYIYNYAGQDKISLTVNPNAANSAARIYTRSPQFTAKVIFDSSGTVDIDWNPKIEYEINDKQMIVTINDINTATRQQAVKAQ